MILSSLAIAGTLGVGVLGISAKVYRQEKRKSQKKLINILALQHHTDFSPPQVTSTDNTNDLLNKVLDTQEGRLGIALSSFALAVGGTLLNPLLGLLSIPGILYITRITIRRAWQTFSQKREITIDALSSANRGLLLLTGHFIFASGGSVFFSLNRYVVGLIKDDSKQKIRDIFQNQSRLVWMEIDGTDVQVPINQLEAGDIIVVNAGEIIPVDGQITAGMATVDQHLLTGEAQPIDKMLGDPVWAMTILLTGRIGIQVESTGEETTAMQIAKLLEKTIDSKTNMQLWVEEWTDRSVKPYMGLSTLAFFTLGPAASIAIMMSHFKYMPIITSSIAILSYIQIALQSGIFVKDGRTFELLNNVDTVVFDKTGTLTHEQPHVSQIHLFADASEEQVLVWAAAAETKQTHPIARAILQEAAKRELDVPVVEESAYRIGFGLCVQTENHLIHVGSARFMVTEEMAFGAALTDLQAACHKLGHSLVFVAVNKQIVGTIELRPTVRPEAKAVVEELRQLGIGSIYIISGDHEMPTKHLAEELELDGYYAETLPAQKAELIKNLQDKGRTVCYIGDGINDAIALKKADVSVSLRGASAIATDTAQVVLLDQNLSQLCQLFKISRDLDVNVKYTLSASIMPSIITLYGSLFWGLGLAYAFWLPPTGLLLGMTIALSPAIRHRIQKTNTKGI